MKPYKELAKSELKEHPDTGEFVPEEWREIEGYDGWYEVSNYGRVRSYKKGNGRWGRDSNPKILKPLEGSHGYVIQNLYRDSKLKRKKVHRLVAKAFHGDPPEGRGFALHRNDIKKDNFAPNIYWGNPKDNHIDLRRNGNYSPPPVLRGENANGSKLTKYDVLEIRKMWKAGDYTYRQIGERFGVIGDNIGRIVRKETWTHV